MPLPRINSMVSVDLTSKEHGSRIGLYDPNNAPLVPLNPRNKIGKFGIANNSGLSKFFHKTIAVEVKDAKTGNFVAVNLNKKSTIKHLNCHLPDEELLTFKSTNAEILAKLEKLPEILTANEEKKKKDIEEALSKGLDVTRKYTPKVSHHRLGKFWDVIRSAFWGTLYNIAASSWIAFKIRFGVFKATEKTRFRTSKVRAATAFTQAKKVPAFRRHLVLAGQDKPFDFSQIPATSKDNYIKPAIDEKREPSLYLNGKIPMKSKRDTSTGTSGKSTPWYRGIAEQKIVERLTSYAAKVVVGNKPYTCINGFAVGPWATGITATLAMSNDSKAGVSVIGPSIPEIWEAIKEHIRINKDRDPQNGHKQPIVVAGYPPHIRAVVDLAVKEGFPLHEYNVIGCVGGESMSEDMRDLIVEQRNDKGEITRTGFKQCYSSYGASDLDINIGYESDFEIEVRKLCHDPKYKKMAEELFGQGEFIPMIFHYDPLNYLIEHDEDRNLFYTCVRQDRISPRVRYNLGDKGTTMSCGELMATLKKYGVELKHQPNTNLPLLFVWGRQGSHIAFRGTKVAPEQLGQTIRTIDKDDAPGFNEKVAHYGFAQEEIGGRTKTHILLEFNEDGDFDAADENMLNNLLNTLGNKVSTDFIVQLNCPPEERMVLHVYKKGESPMAVQQAKYPMRKKQYIFKAGDEFIPTSEELNAKGRIITATA